MYIDITGLGPLWPGHKEQHCNLNIFNGRAISGAVWENSHSLKKEGPFLPFTRTNCGRLIPWKHSHARRPHKTTQLLIINEIWPICSVQYMSIRLFDVFAAVACIHRVFESFMPRCHLMTVSLYQTDPTEKKEDGDARRGRQIVTETCVIGY